MIELQKSEKDNSRVIPEYTFSNKKWGSEVWITNEDEYCGKIIYIVLGGRCSMHCHMNKKETFYVSKGEVLLETQVDNNIEGRYVLREHDSMIIPRDLYHRFTGLERESEIFEVSTHHEEEDSYRDENKLSTIICEAELKKIEREVIRKIKGEK